MKMTSQAVAALALALGSGAAVAQNLPLATENTCQAHIDAVRQGRHTATENADGVFWPPNHKLRTVTITAENDDGDPCNVTITDVRQDEGVDEPGSGNTSPDAANCDNSAGNNANAASVDLRGERSGRLTGRYYTVFFTMDDPDAPQDPQADTAELLVPHDQGVAHLGTYVNEGPLFPSYSGASLNCAQ